MTIGAMKKMETTTGKEDSKGGILTMLFMMQAHFQEQVTGIGKLPVDDVKWFQYHMAAMQEELGEVLKADKRWKTHRNAHFDPENKLEELADVFVTAINLALFSGIDTPTMATAIMNKINSNYQKLQQQRSQSDDSNS